MGEWSIEPLDRSHQRAAFSCDKAQLDRFLRSLVSQYQKRRLGRTYVAVRPGEKRVLGYYTLAASAVSFENLPPAASRQLPRHPVPVILLARLAVDRSVQGAGLGRHLLVDALERCLGLAHQLGVHAVEVDAIDDEAVAFYEKYGFATLLDDRRHLFIPVAALEEAFGTA